ncbi:hypothetical protein A4G99_19465 [Haladaptatus sp. R4]|nr:hypothetical protein A4G99_19465 [Haladaptatus sp. R4]
MTVVGVVTMGVLVVMIVRVSVETVSEVEEREPGENPDVGSVLVEGEYSRQEGERAKKKACSENMAEREH